MPVTRSGHVKIARNEFAGKLWGEKRVFSKFEAWLDMYQLAQYETKEFTSTKFGTIRLERGEFILSLRKMADRWGWSFQSVRSFTRSATFRTRLATQRDTQAGTVYLVLNYGVEESAEPKVTQPITQPATHLQHTSNTRTRSKAVKTTSTTTSASHEARNGSANGTTPSDSKPPNWAAEGAGIWNEQVGPITIGKFGRIMKPMVEKHGWEDSKAAELCYIELKAGQVRNVQWLVNESVRWVDLAKMPTVDPATRQLTEKGRMAYNG